MRFDKPADSGARIGDAQPPVWDLTDLYADPDAPELSRDIETASQRAGAFREKYAGKIRDLTGDDLAAAIADYEAIFQLMGRASSYAQLLHAAKTSDTEVGRFYQTVSEQLNQVSANLLFVSIEINQISDDELTDLLSSSATLRAYTSWIRDQRAMRPHLLSDEMERQMHEREVTARSAWVRLFDETIAGLRFDVNGTQLTETEALNLLSDNDRSVREAAGQALSKTFGENARLFAHITNTLAKDKQIEDRWRAFDRPVSAQNVRNLVEDEVVDALVRSVKSAYPELGHRYYALKARWLGLDKLKFWDRNAPLPEAPEATFDWRDARQIVLDAFGGFDRRLSDTAATFFDNGWIDAEVREGKAGGAFSHPTVPNAHPYVLMNFQGKPRDVTTLAHELGHGVHQVLANGQGYLKAQTPLTLAETASVFGEMLTFRSLLDREQDPRRRCAMLAGKVEDMLNTVIRQIAFHEFERRVHDERQNGELLPEAIGDIWMETQSEALGPAFDLDDSYRIFWSYVPHFLHVPFYVYAYAFGDCLVNALYRTYETEPDGFADRYIEMLSAGGSMRHKELLAPFGLDASDPAFWDRSLDVIRGFIAELEAEA